MEEVMKDSAYYRRSGGGLTLSGGECLLQPDFAGALLRAAKENGLHTAIESTGFAKFETIQEKILPWLDLYLMDIKHMDTRNTRCLPAQPQRENSGKCQKDHRCRPEAYRPCAGDSDFQRYAGRDLRHRPVCQILKGCGGDESSSLPPSGSGQICRYRPRVYTGSSGAASNEHMEMLKEVAKSAGIRVKIGG